MRLLDACHQGLVMQNFHILFVVGLNQLLNQLSSFQGYSFPEAWLLYSVLKYIKG